MPGEEDTMRDGQDLQPGVWALRFEKWCDRQEGVGRFDICGFDIYQEADASEVGTVDTGRGPRDSSQFQGHWEMPGEEDTMRDGQDLQPGVWALRFEKWCDRQEGVWRFDICGFDIYQADASEVGTVDTGRGQETVPKETTHRSLSSRQKTGVYEAVPFRSTYHGSDSRNGPRPDRKTYIRSMGTRP